MAVCVNSFSRKPTHPGTLLHQVEAAFRTRSRLRDGGRRRDVALFLTEVSQWQAKADFSESEWETLQKGATGAAFLVSIADTNFFDTFKEAGAMAGHLKDAREKSSSQLIRELAEARGTGFSLTSSREEIESQTLEALRASTAILQAKAPDEMPGYRDFVLSLVESVAKAASDVAAVESGAIEKVRAALGGVAPDC